MGVFEFVGSVFLVGILDGCLSLDGCLRVYQD